MEQLPTVSFSTKYLVPAARADVANASISTLVIAYGLIVRVLPRSKANRPRGMRRPSPVFESLEPPELQGARDLWWLVQGASQRYKKARAASGRRFGKGTKCRGNMNTRCGPC